MAVFQVFAVVLTVCWVTAADMVPWDYYYPARYEDDAYDQVPPVVAEVASIPESSYIQEAHHQVQERNRQSGTRRNTIVTELESMCSGRSYKLEFKDDEYDYKPSFLQGFQCTDSAKSIGDMDGPRQRSCPTNNCVSHDVEYQIVRKRKGTGCWEPYPININVTCECMASHNTHIRTKKPYLNMFEKLQQQARLNELGNLV